MNERAAAMKHLIAISFSIKPNDLNKILDSFMKPSAAFVRALSRKLTREKIEIF